MATQELRNANNVLLGKIHTLSDGRLEIRDKNNVLKGIYNPKQNETRNANNVLIGKGNMLSSLL